MSSEFPKSDLGQDFRPCRKDSKKYSENGRSLLPLSVVLVLHVRDLSSTSNSTTGQVDGSETKDLKEGKCRSSGK